MNAVIYARFSSYKQQETSIEGQLQECYAYAERNNITVINEYIDRATTGKNDKRPSFQKMIAESEKKQFEIVLVYQFDRFARHREDSILYKKKLSGYDVRVVSARENISDDASGVLVEGVLESMAEYFSVELSQKVRRGMGLNAEKCLSNGGTIPLGFKVDNTKHYQVDTQTSPIVQEIYQRYADGETAKQICDSLNERQLKSARNSVFNKNSLHKLLQNKKYIGVYCYGDVEIADGIPRIISDDLFQKVQERLKSNRAAPSRTRAVEEYLLTTKLFCGHCQAMMAGISGTGKAGTKYHYYSCNNARIKKCSKHNVRKDDIEKAVLDAAKAMLTNENISLIAEDVVKICKKESESPTFLITQNQLKDNEKQKSNLMAALRTGSADEPVTRMILDELNQLSAATHILETKIAAEKLRQVEISVPRIKFFLSQLAEGKMDDKHYKKYLVNIFVNKIYVFDDGHCTAFFNTQKEPVAIDFNLFTAAEKTFETCSSVTQYGAPCGNAESLVFPSVSTAKVLTFAPRKWQKEFNSDIGSQILYWKEKRSVNTI